MSKTKNLVYMTHSSSKIDVAWNTERKNINYIECMKFDRTGVRIADQ
jgi:hypothetical protein